MPKSEAAKIMTLGAAATAIGGAYKVGEFLMHAKKLKDVAPSNAVYVRMINRVRSDLDEVTRLCTVPEVKEALKANPPKAKWVYGAMRDVRGALENIVPHTERVGGDVEKGKRVGIRHRFYWLMSEKEKLENREKEVNAAHGSLMEVIGYLTALEPVDPNGDHAHDKAHGVSHGAAHTQGTHDTKNTKIDIDIRHAGAERVEKRDVWIEREGDGPRRVVEERETFIEHEHRGPRHFDEREVRIEREHLGPRHVEEREIRIERDHRGHGHGHGHGHDHDHKLQFVRHHDHGHGHAHVHDERDIRIEREHEHRAPQHFEEREVRRVEREYQVDEYGRPVRFDERETYVDPRDQDPRYQQFTDGRSGPPVHERELHIERDPRDPRHVEARYTERGPNHFEEKRYEERRMGAPLGRRPESFEDRVPERETWMQSEAQRNAYARQSGHQSERRTYGDPGFGDEEILNPQIVPYEREMWIEEKEDFSHDQYGNKLPDRFQPTRFPRSRM